MAAIELLLSIAWCLLIFLCIRRAVQHARVNRRKDCAFRAFVATSLLIFGIMIGLVPGSSAVHDTILLHRFTGQWSIPFREKFESDWGGITGDGDSIRVWKVSESVANPFKNPDQEFLQSYPRTAISRANYKRSTWQPTPVAVPEGKMKPGGWAMGHPELQKMLAEPGNYWCMTKKPEGDAIEIAVINPITGRMIYLESST